VAGSLFDRVKGLLQPSAPEPTAEVPRKKPVSPYHAVEIQPGRNACAAALALGSRRFLSREAPPLPLAACDRSKCDCRYEHHDDRRKGGRRANDLGVSIEGHESQERRDPTRRGRRKTDRK
jgi:hypothetical protein